MKTQTELLALALTRCGATGTGETASAEDTAKAAAALPDLLDELAAERVCYVPISGDADAEEIPNELFRALAHLLALDIGPDVAAAMPATDAQREDAKMILRRLSAQKPTYETLSVDYF